MRIGLPIAVAFLTFASPALSQSSDFNLTYHVERTPAARLSLATCGNAVAQVARQSRLSVDVQSFPGQLVIVKGGRGGVGAFVVQCIAVGNTTVSVVQGIDYKVQKGALGQFADRAFAAVKAAIK
jgi:NADPH:quinone reductase-like Zn-dependent oxidoreductase